MRSKSFEHQASKILAVLGNPFRVQLVMTLWAQEACVCHLEALLKKRQAYISQHLMALRELDLLETRRDGKYIYYRLANEEIIDLIKDAGLIAGYEREKLPRKQDIKVLDKCICPNCDGEDSEKNELQQESVLIDQ
jgi:DNA-binding transcriptional ArsR family regulator